MTVPAEIYSFGWQYALLLPSLIFVTLVTNYVSLPVFYCNNIENCYVVSVKTTRTNAADFNWYHFQYLDLRFGKATCKILTILYVLLCIFFLPLMMYIPALAFVEGNLFRTFLCNKNRQFIRQTLIVPATKQNIHIVNIIVCYICVIYTMLGGIKAVVWTDVSSCPLQNQCALNQISKYRCFKLV